MVNLTGCFVVVLKPDLCQKFIEANALESACSFSNILSRGNLCIGFTEWCF